MNQLEIQERRTQVETFFASGIWFLLTLFIALPQGLETRLILNGNQVPHSASPQIIRNAWGQGDAGSLLDTAITWSKFHQIDRVSQFWIVHLWTPGMSMIEVPLIWISKLGIPIFWSLLFITLMTWSTIFWFTWRFISPIIGRAPCIGIAAVLLSSWDFRYFFRDDLFYTEGLAFGFLLLGLGFTAWAYLFESAQKFLYVVGGVLIGASIMIRYVSDIGLFLLLVVASLLVIFEYKNNHSNLIKEMGSNRSIISIRNHLKIFVHLKTFGVWTSCIVAFAFTIPWRLASYFIFNGPFLTLSSASGLVGPGLWIPNSKLGFWKFYGMNWGCVIDSVKCRALNHHGMTTDSSSSLLLKGIISAFQHPIAYLDTRWHFLALRWILRDSNSGFLYLLENVASIIPIMLLIVGLILFKRNRLSGRAGWIWLPLLLAEVAQLFIVHYESRYFIPVRLFALGFFVFILLGEKTRLKNVRT